jgi:hypothetical protein
MRRLTHAEATRLRTVPGATVALFLTDRCPVGCAHCSVGALPDGPAIADWGLFAALVGELAAAPALRAVAITGGEPFAERRGLAHAVDRLTAADKAVVVFTSGSWARRTVPAWARDVLTRTGTVCLSTDAYHAAGLAVPGVPDAADGALQRAAGAVLDAGCHLVVQVLAGADGAAAAHEAAARRFPAAEISVVRRLPTGRGARLFPPGERRPADAFGPCGLLNAPTVRYDGVVTACCNEAVITGGGPAGLRRAAGGPGGIAAAVAAFRADPVLRLMGTAGPVALAALAPGPFHSVCEPCWLAQRRAAADGAARASLTRLAAAGALLAGPG